MIVLFALIAACGSQPAGGPSASLVEGVVAAGPIFPVSRPGAPDTRPVGAAEVQALRDGEVVAVTRTDAGGRYELRLGPGAYLIVASSDRYLRRRQSHPVSVAAAESVTVNFLLDTGIR